MGRCGAPHFLMLSKRRIVQTNHTRHLTLPETHNIRDLGGYALADGGTTQWRRMLRGDSLAHLTDAGRDELVAGGLGLVIDLRGEGEIAVEPNPFMGRGEVEYRNIPLFDALAPIGMAETPFDMAARYCDALDRCGARVAQVLRAIAEAPEGMVLFHCTAGKDRTGIVAAMLLLLAGVAEGDVIEDYALTAVVAAPMLKRLREAARLRFADDAHIDLVLASDAATMRAMLWHLEVRHGGIAAYGAAIGLSGAEIGQIVDRLCR